MRTQALRGLLAIGLLVGSSTVAWSDDKEGNIADLVKDAKVTAEEAIKTATEKVPGTVVEAELEKKHGKTVWEVEILGADGKVTEAELWFLRELQIHARDVCPEFEALVAECVEHTGPHAS